MIESKDKRIVHFLFNPGYASKISPFARRFNRLLEGTLQQFMETEKQMFDEYIEKFKNEELEENETNPIQYEDSPYFQFQLEGIHRVCFSTADDPFYKLPFSKFYPEAVIVDPEGKIVTKINPENKKDDALQLNYMDDFRDPALKINDDKKIQIGLGAFKIPGTSIFLIVRESDLTGKPVKENEFDRAWFRLSNEETNQTMDYSLINKIERSEEYQPTLPAEDEEAPPTLNPLSYLHGRLFLDEKGHWVFESIKKSFEHKDFPDLAQQVAQLYGEAQAEYNEQ